MPVSSDTQTFTRSERIILRLIAIFKLVKSVSLIVISVGLFRLHHQDTFDRFVDWLRHLPLADNLLGHLVVDGVTKLGPEKFQALGLVAIGYAVIFGIEGTGLWLRKHWAEWFSVIATGSLIPFEIYELFPRFSALKLLALLVNAAIAIYLIGVARRTGKKHH